MTLQTFLTRLIWLCVLPLVLLAVYLAANHVQSMQAQFDREAADQARNVATTIDRQLGAQIAALQVLAASPLLDDPPRLNEFYKEASGFRESFGSHVILAGVSMQMILNTRAPFGSVLPKLPRPRGRAAVPIALETGRPAVGDIVRGPIALEPLIAVVVPVRRDGATRNLLLGTIETRQFQQRLDEMAFPPGGILTLLDGTGEVIARRLPPEMKGRPNDEPVERRIVVKSVASSWSVVLEIPRSVYRAPIIAAAAALAAAIMAFTLISVLGGRAASRRLARSVAALAGASSSQPSDLGIVELEDVRRRLADATAAREAEESARRESEERSRAIASNTPDHILVQDRNLRYEWVINPQLGLTEADMVGKTDSEILGAEDAEKLTAIKRRVLETGTPEHHEASLLNLAGTTEYFEGSYVPRRDATGRTNGLIGYFRNVTERIRAEEAKRELNERIVNILENMGDAFVALDRDWRYTYVNRKAGEIFGRDAASLVGKHIWTEFPEGVGQPFHLAYERAMATQVPMRIEEYYPPYGGWFENRIFPNPDGLAIFFTDVTDRKRAEEALRASELKLRKVIDGLGPHNFVGLLTPDGIVLEANRPALTAAGLTREDVLGKPVNQTYWFAHSELVQEQVRSAIRAAAAGVAFRGDVEIRVGMDAYAWIDLSFQPMRDDKGHIEYLVGSAAVITERKQAEEKLLEQLDELQRWHEAVLGREERVAELKREVNELLRRLGEAARYGREETAPDDALERVRE
jgi:PAS domain S-box-containing protein